MRVKSTKKIKSKNKNSNQLELTFRENIKNKKNTNSEYNKSFNAITRIFLSSFVIISFFYITPIFINFADKNFNNKEFKNNSKKILAYTLNGKNQKTKDNENLTEEDLLIKINENSTYERQYGIQDKNFEDYKSFYYKNLPSVNIEKALEFVKINL